MNKTIEEFKNTLENRLEKENIYIKFDDLQFDDKHCLWFGLFYKKEDICQEGWSIPIYNDKLCIDEAEGSIILVDTDPMKKLKMDEILQKLFNEIKDLAEK